MSYAGAIAKAGARPAGKAPAAGPMARAGPVAPFGKPLQAKMALGPVADRFEREADSAARHVVGGAAGPPGLTSLPLSGLPGVQRACAACGAHEEETSRAARVQRKCACGAGPGEPCSCEHRKDLGLGVEHDEEEHAEMQIDRKASRQTDGGQAAVRDVEEVVSGPGRPLPAQVRRDMEKGFGRDFSQVRIHDGARAARSAEGIGARAYTVGNHIAFNHGQYRPGTGEGRFLLAHELAHTVQQSRGPGTAQGISRPADPHEAQADRAAHAATTSGAPMPVLSAGAAPISRYSLGEFGDDLLSVGEAVVDTALDLPGDVVDTVGGLASSAIDIARAVGGAISRDGATIVIDIPDFNPCPDIGFEINLSDLGLSPTLYYPIAIGAGQIGPLVLLGILGVEAQLDSGVGLRLKRCKIGPAQIRISPLSGRVSVSGAASFEVGAAANFAADLGLSANVTGFGVIPTSPPITFIVPTIGINAGGAMALQIQGATALSGSFAANGGLTGVSHSMSFSADLGLGLDLFAGLMAALRIKDQLLCQVAWTPVDVHRYAAARLALASHLSLGTSGLGFGFSFSARPISGNPLADLRFAFGHSPPATDCRICDFLHDNGLMPGQKGYDWAHLEPSLSKLGGPLRDVYRRDPGLASGALCRGTCGVDCPPKPSCTNPYDLTRCVERGEKHEWHTYVNYARCGTHQGCRDHDACYDYAATMPIWGFGGFMIGPMYRACDAEAACTYGFGTAIGWARGGGPYDGRLRYADSRYVTPGCIGPCPKHAEGQAADEPIRYCVENKELLEAFEAGDEWSVQFGTLRLYQGFLRVPYIGGVHYGIDATGGASASAAATLGPINLENVCLIYNPVDRSYRGTAELALQAQGDAGASVTGRLDGWVADPFCLLQVLGLGGDITGTITASIPAELRFGVQLYCEKGDLHVRPSSRMTVGLLLGGSLQAGFDIRLLGFRVFRQEWELGRAETDQEWSMEYVMEPFVLGQSPSLSMVSTGLDVLEVLLDLFGPAAEERSRRQPPRPPVPEGSVFLPCWDSSDEEEEAEGPSDCPDRADGAQADAITTPAQRQPRYGTTRTISIPGGDSAGVATSMEVEYLTASHPEGEETNDTVQRGIYKKVGLPTSGCVGKGYKQSQVFVKGHLLNASLGGPAEERNLFPITGQANSDHKNRVEQKGLRVVKRVNDDGDVMYYKVRVTNASAPQQILDSSNNPTDFYKIDATFHCEVADYQYCTNDTLRRNPVQSVNIRSEFLFHPSGGKAFDTIMKDCSR